MGSVSGLLGVGGGFQGTGIDAARKADMTSPIENGQIATAYGGTQNSLQSQQALLQALQSQQGLQNQNQVYNQTQGVINGTGPNPAQTMLNQATGQNVQNQAALMAGQRGASQNVGLIARQAAQQGSQIQQQAAGQAANMQAQQSLNAIGQAGSIAGNQVANQIGQTNANTQANQAQHQALMNAQLGVNSNNTGMQSNINNINGQLANTVMQGQQATTGGILQSVSTMGGLMKAEGGDVVQSDDSSTPSFGGSSGAATINKDSGGSGGGGIMQMLPMLAMALAGGGDVAGPQSTFGQFINSVGMPGAVNTSTPAFGSDSGAAALEKGVASASSMHMPGGGGGSSMAGGAGDDGGALGAAAMAAKGGMVPALVSPGEEYLSPADVKKVQRGANPLSVGKKVPGKPVVGGAVNSYANDIVPTKLETGGIVIPRKVTMGKDPVNDSAKFVAAVLAKRRFGK